MVGYLLAGVLIGPATPGFVADMGLAAQLSEIGVMLLMFGVATALGTGVALLWDWDLGGALVLGLSLSVASTVVLLRALEARGALQSMNGRIAVGWLIVEDLVMVLALVLLPALADFLNPDGQEDTQTLLATLGVVAAAVGVAFGAAKLFDPAVVWEQPFKLLMVLAIILLGKTVATVALVLLFRYPVGTALTVAVSLAGALISIAANSALFGAIEPVQAWLRQRSPWLRRMEAREDPLASLPYSTDPRLLTGHVVLVGCGRVGAQIVEALRQQGRAVVVLDHNRERIESLRLQGLPAVHGQALDPESLVQAHVAQASLLVLALPDAQDARRIVELARQLNAQLSVVIRAHSADEADLLRQSGLGTVLCPDEEMAQAMVRSVTSRGPG